MMSAVFPLSVIHFLVSLFVSFDQFLRAEFFPLGPVHQALPTVRSLREQSVNPSGRRVVFGPFDISLAAGNQAIYPKE